MTSLFFTSDFIRILFKFSAFMPPKIISGYTCYCDAKSVNFRVFFFSKTASKVMRRTYNPKGVQTYECINVAAALYIFGIRHAFGSNGCSKATLKNKKLYSAMRVVAFSVEYPYYVI